MNNEILRHTLATIAYRFQKSISSKDSGYGDFSAGEKCRSPKEIINHIFHVLNSTRIFMETETYHNEQPEKLDLMLEIRRFINEIAVLDQLLSRQEINVNYTKRLIQGPFSDVLTHIGQLSMLSGLYGYSIPGEDFSAADIKIGVFN